MDIDQAIEIVTRLADGVDPVTGERLLSSSEVEWMLFSGSEFWMRLNMLIVRFNPLIEARRCFRVCGGVYPSVHPKYPRDATAGLQPRLAGTTVS